MDSATTLERRKTVPLRLRKILVPVDPSEPSGNALSYASRFAQSIGARLVLMQVVPPTAAALPPPHGKRDDPELTAMENLALVCAGVGWQDHGAIPPPETHVCTGVAHEEIARVARELEAHLIILPTRGFTGASGSFAASTTAYLVDNASCPVLVVREHEHESC